MPIVGFNADGRRFGDWRRRGFILMVDGKRIDKETGKPKKIECDVTNAMSEKLTSSSKWKWSVHGSAGHAISAERDCPGDYSKPCPHKNLDDLERDGRIAHMQISWSWRNG